MVIDLTKHLLLFLNSVIMKLKCLFSSIYAIE